MADDNCITCGNIVRPRQHAIQCDLCQKWNHRTCGTGISQDEYRRMMREDSISWQCSQCEMPPEEEHLDDTVPFQDSEPEMHPDTEPDTSFEISHHTIAEPVVPIESSFEANDTIDDVELDHNPDPVFSVIEEGTKRLKRKLTDSRGFTYNVKRTRKDKIDWQCSVRSRVNPCRATVRQHNDTFIPGPTQHNHHAKPGIDISANMEAQIRKQAKENVFVPASTIVDEAMLNHGNSEAPEHSRPVHSNMLRLVNRVRQRLRPNDPTDMDFELDMNFIPENFLLADIDIEGNRHLIFSTPEQIHMLSRAKTWYLDGTFKVVRRPFMQLFSIHSFIRSGAETKQVPLVFILMSRRRTIDYKKVFRVLRRSMGTTRLEKAVCDFEPAVWMAIQDSFPDVQLQGCVFHWAQAINRKTGELGLQTAYREDDRVHKFVRQVLALPFLPGDHIHPAFRQLARRTTNDRLSALLRYVEDTWIKSSVWSTDTWSVYMQPIRTNNDVEGWHRHLNMKAQDSKPPMYVLVKLLFREASLLPMQLQMVSEGKLRRRCREHTETVQGQLFQIWDSYEEDRISVSQLLKSCGRLYSF